MKTSRFIKMTIGFLLLLWLGFSIFAYTHHNVTDQVMSISEYIEFENYGVLVKNIEIRDYERNFDTAFNDFDWYRLPEPLIMPVMQIAYFYSDPYKPVEHVPEYRINCEVIPNEGFQYDDMDADLRIGPYDEKVIENFPGFNRGSETDSDDNAIRIHRGGNWQDTDYIGIYLKDMDTEELATIPLDGEFEEMRYSFFKRRERSTYYSAEHCFASLYYEFNHESPEDATMLIHSEGVDDFDWEALGQVDIGDKTRSNLDYLGTWNGFDDVFELTYYDGDRKIETKSRILMVYDKDQWYIAALEEESEDLSETEVSNETEEVSSIYGHSVLTKDNIYEEWNHVWDEVSAEEGKIPSDQLDSINRLLSPELVREKYVEVNPISCFFTSYYDNPKDIDLADFLMYCPGGHVPEELPEFDELKELDKWPFEWVSALEDMPVPIHRYDYDVIEGYFDRFAGIRINDLTDLEAEGVYYLESTDAFYNYTSDFGPGVFICYGGEVEDNFIKLYGDARNDDYPILTIEKVGTEYFIRSYNLEE